LDVWIGTSLKILSGKQKKVIDMRYVEKMTLFAISRKVWSWESSSGTILDEALDKIRTFLFNGSISEELVEKLGNENIWESIKIERPNLDEDLNGVVLSYENVDEYLYVKIFDYISNYVKCRDMAFHLVKYFIRRILY
jgi:hypothetical protein